MKDTLNSQDWNINKGYGDDVVVPQIVNVNEAARQGNVNTWFNEMRVLFRCVAGHEKMDPEQVKKLDKNMREVRDKYLKDKIPDDITEQALYFDDIKTAKTKLDDINMRLLTEMHKAGLLFTVAKTEATKKGFQNFWSKYIQK